MRALYRLLIVLLILSTAFFTFSCTAPDKGAESSPPQEPEQSTTDADNNTAQPEVPGNTDEGGTKNDPIYFVGNQADGCYIVYGGMTEYDAAIALRSVISEQTGTTLVANSYLIYENATTSELIVGLTNRESANQKITAIIADIAQEIEYFFFVQSEDDLIFYATSPEAYSAGVMYFAEYFLTDGEFLSPAGIQYVEFLTEE